MDLNLIYRIILGVGVLVALMLTALIFFTGKGDAMSGGGSGVRTSFKGKSSFDDKISNVTFILGGSFFLLMVILDIISHKIFTK